IFCRRFFFSGRRRRTSFSRDWSSDVCSSDLLHCCWKENAIEVLNRIGRDYRIAYTSSNAIAISSAVLTDLAVGFLPESALQPGKIGRASSREGMEGADLAASRSRMTAVPHCK